MTEIFTKVEYKKNLEDNNWADQKYEDTLELTYAQLSDMINTEAKYSSLRGQSYFSCIFSKF